MLLSGLHEYCIHVVHIHTYRQNTHIGFFFFYKKPWEPEENDTFFKSWKQTIINLDSYTYNKYLSGMKEKSRYCQINRFVNCRSTIEGCLYEMKWLENWKRNMLSIKMNGMLCRVFVKHVWWLKWPCVVRGTKDYKGMPWEGKSLNVTQFGKARSLVDGGYLCMYNTGPVLYLKDVIKMHRKLYKS